ncbi:hypothetical protein ACWGNU_28735 [Paenibacillus lautus]|uniref:hypothetical protein n=1 Tax=Paenibacillus lautus TaxID=1401 RepID=UPI0020425FAF|nr:hypothetical protein [Paenibacillus lautus]MCM3259180.1 hypothetical protein [Paenibacillus lautus]
MKKKFGVLLSVAIGLTLVNGVGQASAATYTICDNDPVASNCGMYFGGLPEGGTAHWVYRTGAGYNNDYRLIANASYPYETASISLRRPSGNFIAGSNSVYAYINSAFTSRTTRYWVFPGGGVVGNSVGTLNQYNASTGWNYVGSFNTSGNWDRLDIQVEPQGQAGTNDGLDAIEIVSP